MTPVLDAGPHPDFVVRARNGAVDHVEFLATSYGHTRNYIDRPLLRGLLESHWSYNEYVFRMEDRQGRIGGTEVTGRRRNRAATPWNTPGAVTGGRRGGPGRQSAAKRGAS